MPIKIIKKLFLKDLPSNIKKNFAVEVKREMADEIAKEILSGKSPVTGDRFEEYSDSYEKIKRRKKPVDMLNTGEMLDSLTIKQDKMGRVKIFFKDKKAKWHQEGEGNLPVRRLLPARDEEFNARLNKALMKLLKNAVKKTIKKQ